MGNTNNVTPATRAKLEAKLHHITSRLWEVNVDLADLEDIWGGSPFQVDPAQYEHDPVAFKILMLARHRYGYLLYERALLQDVAATIRQRLKEVRP